MKSFEKQVGGSHYKKLAIQPTEYAIKNGLGFAEGNVIKYVTRYKDKNGVEDLKKAMHYLEMLIEQHEQIHGTLAEERPTPAYRQQA